MPLPRYAAERLAKQTGYFWLPCPFPGCGEMFAGFETGEYTMYDDPENPNIGSMTCHKHDDLVRQEVEAAGFVYQKGMRILKWLTRTP
jgi:hypothetical protein